MLDCRASEFEIRAHAQAAVSRTKTLLSGIGRAGGMPETTDQLEHRLNELARACKARPVRDDATLSGRIGRMCDPQWWARNVRGQLLKENENLVRTAGLVRRKEQVYVSDHAVRVKRMRRKANRDTLEALEVASDHGDALNLLEVTESSNSNPAIRRAELLMRCRGFEDVAKAWGHTAIFLTLTAPSRFHRVSHHGILNPKWDGTTPKQAQEYLCGIWSKIRAAWKRRGFTPYGFRVAEPHHDGCPHWHILLFCPNETTGWFHPGKLQGEGLIGIAGKYALKESPGEPGAAKHRFTYKYIDPGEGSATGYIAKYISKNIDGMREDGEAIGLDYDSGRDATEASGRVRDWASVWGIRQFQQIGGPSVTVWRELRRMREEIQQPLQAAFDWEAPRAAADDSQWGLFWAIQGGPDTPRAQLTLKPFYVESDGGKYGEAVKRILGVAGTNEAGGFMLQTHVKEWRIQRAGTANANDADAEQKEWRRINRNVQAFQRAGGIEVNSDVRYPIGFDAVETARTRVNNCTDVPRGEPADAALVADEVREAERALRNFNAKFAGVLPAIPSPGGSRLSLEH